MTAAQRERAKELTKAIFDIEFDVEDAAGFVPDDITTAAEAYEWAETTDRAAGLLERIAERLRDLRDDLSVFAEELEEEEQAVAV